MTRQQRMRVELPAIIALGSNLGDREQTLREAVSRISAVDGVHIVAASGIVESAALKVDRVDESAPSYLNAVIRVRTALSPEALLDALQAIETELGRERIERWGDRTLDLDIVSFAALQSESERLELPHPRAWQRAFVLAPWLQIDAEARLPGRGRIADLAREVTDSVRPFDADPLWETPMRNSS